DQKRIGINNLEEPKTNELELPVDAELGDDSLQADLFKQTAHEKAIESINSEVSQAHTMTFDNTSDAPACDTCGSIMVRNGACYKCLNCGATSGCS
ncbi:hypothetical protein KJ766_01455, partial [Patescibacteria group bacterium]|nr:hypothetical protein [Patescibacteria group bacterium]